jgi:hypothetical protein
MTTPTLDLTDGSALTELPAKFDGPKVWDRSTLSEPDWTVRVTDDVIAELAQITSDIRRYPVPVYLLDPVQFDMPACKAMMASAEVMIRSKQGFAILDRLPLDGLGWTDDESRAVFWLLSQLVSRPVAQSVAGDMFQDIRAGRVADRETAGPAKVLGFHQDNSGGKVMPQYTALMALRAAREGGYSEYCSLYSLYNALLEESEEVVQRLFEPFYHDRLGNVGPDEPDVIWAPAVRYVQGRLAGRISMQKIPVGYQKAGKELDAAGRGALEAVNATIEEHSLSAQFRLEGGQMIIFRNLDGMHYRRPFQDGDDVSQQRHVVRIWLRDSGRISFDG